MQCPDQYEWELYLDGEQPPTRQEELRKHLAECPSCSEIVESLSREYHLFAEALAAAPLPPDLEVFIKQRLTISKHKGGKALWFLLTVIALVGIFMVLYNGWSLIEQIWSLAGFLGNGDMLLQLFFTASRLMFNLAGTVLQGQPVLPSLTILILCVLWMRIKLIRGGRVHV